VKLELIGGRTLTGRVLARSSREVIVGWDELEGTLELKAFPLGPHGRALALRAASWATQQPPGVAELEAWMTTACAALAESLAPIAHD
jgi:hypothetical protein